MYDKFLKLSKEKQDRIINASLNVFSNSLYKNASTDDIVKIADISKGSLFNYFNSKKELYLYMIDYAIDVITKEFYNNLNLNETDIFVKYKETFLLKINLMKIYPNIFDFLINIYSDDTVEFKDEILMRFRDVNHYNKIFNNIDKSKFREDIDIDLAIRMIDLTFTGYGEKELANLQNYGLTKELKNKWLTDINQLINLMKKIYYKGE